MVVNDVVRNAVEPGRELGPRLKTRQRLPDLDEDLLREIPGLSVVFDHVVNHCVNFPPVTADEFIEGCGVATLAGLHQLQIAAGLGLRIHSIVVGGTAPLAVLLASSLQTLKRQRPKKIHADFCAEVWPAQSIGQPQNPGTDFPQSV